MIKSKCLNASSIKTRIETLSISETPLLSCRLNASSIKTRIETTRTHAVWLFAKSLNASSIKTRIETGFPYQKGFTGPAVLTPLPLKQGLKHVSAVLVLLKSSSLNASSIKTRIETIPDEEKTMSSDRLNASSIKTRIETEHPNTYHALFS